MKYRTNAFSIPLLIALLVVASGGVLGACGGSAHPDEGSSASTAGGEAGAELEAHELRKLDAQLVERIKSDDGQLIPIRVRFTAIPDEAELGALLLRRVGNVVVGQVSKEALERIARRPDVEEVELVRDAGYGPG